METNRNVLVVDDETVNRTLLCSHLRRADYRPESAVDGAAAWELLQRKPNEFSIVLLDWCMPRLDGLEVLNRIKGHPELKDTAVILQTGLSAQENVNRGIAAGAFYYLTKPVPKKTLLTVVESAAQKYRERKELQNEVRHAVNALRHLDSARFTIRTVDDVKDLATFLAAGCPVPSRVVTGLSELLLNAVEHGNLGITYDEKSALNERGVWATEVRRRLELPENRDKRVAVDFESTPTETSFVIRDEGDGFDWESYLEVSPERLFDNHGRGIVMANRLSFDRLEYRGSGNEVYVAVNRAAEG